ncbi:FKBP-type peptidyl-prolyl cis-trans isomerase [Candidatus Micrarchaeota archaeon]|nr:FKBP-type peptidyl-prolyl cis-trans isomerase [Candidatus Micrarchaeota archaeon]
MAEFIKVTYTGREKDTKDVFDTNSADEAKKAGMFVKDRDYKPTLMIVGESQLIKGFEEALAGMSKNDKKTTEITPDKAYGERLSELVKLVPMKVFTDNKIKPVPGMIVDVDGHPVRVQSVSGGRVRLDFNHELAGKTLVFDILVNERLEKPEEIIQALFERLFPELKEKIAVKKSEKETEITVPKSAVTVKNYQGRKLFLIQEIKRYLKIENVKISEQY